MFIFPLLKIVIFSFNWFHVWSWKMDNPAVKSVNAVIHNDNLKKKLIQNHLLYFKENDQSKLLFCPSTKLGHNYSATNKCKMKHLASAAR